MVRDLVRQGGRLVSKDRFEGCVLSDPGVCWASEVSAVHLEGKSLPVPLPFIRTVMCPTSLHKGYETNSGLSQIKGNKINNLLGRPPGHCQQPTVFEYSDQFDPRIIPGVKPSNQREQISHGTYPGDCILGISSVISSYDHISPPGKNQENLTGGGSPSSETLIARSH